MNKTLTFCVLLCLPLCAFALPLNPQQEARAKALFRQLHCVVCGGQSLAGSDAKIAQDIRSLVREKIAHGQSDEQITTYLVERYGEGILMQPPLRASTLPLWLAPVIFLSLAGLIAWRIIFSSRRKQAL